MGGENRTIYTTGDAGRRWPTREQELLLRAALLQGSEAIAAWQRWKSCVAVDQIDHGSQRLLPLLYWNLQKHGVEDPLMGRFKGVYRSTWYKNQIAFQVLAAVLTALHTAGIQTVVLKGAALILLYYKDYGLCPMNDLGVLVRTEHASAAINLLTELGWTPMLRPLETFNDEYFTLWHAHRFEDAAGRQFDLHWHVLLECCYENADDDFWNSAVPVNIHDVSTYALDPADQLLRVCVHGPGWGPTPLVAWVADAMTIMDTSQSEIDWDRLIAQAEQRRLVLPLTSALRYLRRSLNASIPAEVLQSMQGMPVSRIERVEHLSRARLPRLLGRLSAYWFRYLRSSQSGSDAASRARFVGFPRFLQVVWALDHLWQVPFYAVFKGVRRIWATVTGRRAKSK